MLRLLKIWLPVLLVLAILRDSEGKKPRMVPTKPEIYINENEPLELSCMSTNKMKFYYPTDVGDRIETSPADLEEQTLGDDNVIIFRRPETTHGDTGWYGCADYDVEVAAGVYDELEVSWTYVYVKSNTSFFVQNDEIISFREVVGGTATIPCRPTSPHYKVILNGNDEEIEIGERVSYDPRIGFKLGNLSLRDSGYYQCLIEQGEERQEVNFHLLVMRNQPLSNPKIIEDTLRHVTRGQTLQVNCTTDVDADIQFVLNWKTPQRVQSSRVSTRLYKENIAMNKQITTCELTINDVTDEDQGEYECRITTFSAMKKVKTNITVYDPDIKFINLTSPDKNRHYVKKYGDRTQWVVEVNAYPQPRLKWLNPRGDEIIGTWNEPDRPKHAISYTPSSTILRINRLDLNDMGLYSLQATNEDRIETLNFTLEVIAKPIPMLGAVKTFYMPKQKIKIPCHVAAYPAPNISWAFLKAPNYPSFDGAESVELKNYSMVPKVSMFESVVVMTTDISGHLTCTACNTLGCDSATDLILVSDVPDGFGIIETNKQVTEGDNVEIICAASLYNYTSVEWLNNKDEKIVDTDRISTTKSSTDFTHRSTLRIKNVQKSDNNSYFVCSAGEVYGDVVLSNYKLMIHDPMAPIIWETNMNKTTVSLDLSTEGHKTVVLKCHVQGMPKPNVTWYKDDMRIKANDQYECRHDNQELYIKYLLDSNSGRYTCKAENRFGKDENYQIIVLKVKEASKAWIAAIIVLAIIMVVLIIFFMIKVRREKMMRKQLMEAGLTHFEEGALECLNPDLTVDDQAELLPYDRKWEFPRERLKFGKQLGFGAFGVVMKADAQGICDDEAVTTVAVKMVRRSTESTYIRALASELKIMVHLGKHLNVVNLLGACTKNITKRELLVIVEYCRFGNLHNYLLRHRADFINQIDPATRKLDLTIGLDILTRTMSVGSNNSLSGNSCNSSPGAELVSYTVGTDSAGVSMSPDGCVLSNNSTQPGWRSNYSGDYKDQNLKPICTQDLLSWAFQVARGMEYLSQRKVLHGDLAARNILLAENNIVKICDFGLAKTMYKDDNYKKKGDAPLPIKWMAIESIRDRVFSTQSDIWSFGIVLWEFFTLAKTPYPGMEAEKQYQRLIEGYRMEQPEYATDEVYDIMLQCWKAKPTLRPTFTDVVSSIGDLLEESVKEHYVDLNAPYLDMNTMVLESGKNDYLTMMSAPDHDALVSPSRDYVNSPSLSPGPVQEDSYIPMSPSNHNGDSGIFSPRIESECGKFEFPSCDVKSSVHSDSESEAVELSPMLKNHEDDNYLKPINVHERRAEFARQRQAMRDAAKREKENEADSGYCNAPRNLRLIELNETTPSESATDGTKKTEVNSSTKDPKDYVPSIIRTQDNYVNMPRQKNDLRKDNSSPSSFSNPSYIIMGNREMEKTGA